MVAVVLPSLKEGKVIASLELVGSPHLDLQLLLIKRGGYSAIHGTEGQLTTFFATVKRMSARMVSIWAKEGQTKH